MEAAKFIKRIARKASHGGNTSNKYDFSRLVALLLPYAEEELTSKATMNTEEKAKLTPKGHKQHRLQAVK